MDARINKNVSGAGKTSLTINGDFTVYTVSELKDGLIETLNESVSLEIDMSNISKIDTAGYQLLLLLSREAGELNKDFSIVSPSSDAERLFRLYKYEYE